MDQLLGVVDGWMENFGGCFPSTIQVTARQRAPIVAIDDAVWVQHWNNFEDKVLPQQLRLYRVRRSKEVESSFHHPRANGFSRVHPSC